MYWFHHFERCGGTSVVRAAETHGERLWQPNRNGDPATDDDWLRLWEWDADRLSRFLDDCEAKGVTFVCSTYGAPLWDVLKERVTLITALRDPWGRYVSHYHYAWSNGYNGCRTMEEFAASGKATQWSFNRLPNYYTRILSRRWLEANVGMESLDQARDVLSSFSVVTLDGIAALTGWTLARLNGRRHPIIRFLSFAKNRRYALAVRAIRPAQPPTHEDRRRFDTRNRADIALVSGL